jgi:hypothetical protein
LVGEEALEVEEARGVGGDEVVGAGLEGGVAFDPAHGGGDGGVFGGEGAAEAAAGLVVGEFDEFDVADVFEEGAGLGVEAEFTEAVTAVVVGDFVGEAGAEVGDAEVVDEEGGELVDAGGEGGGGGVFGVAGEEFEVEFFEHGAAGAGGDDDGFGVGEGLQDGAGDVAGVVPVAGVEGGLAAADGVFGESDVVAEFFEDLNHGETGLGGGDVHEAGDENRNGHCPDLRLGDSRYKKTRLFVYRVRCSVLTRVLVVHSSRADG